MKFFGFFLSASLMLLSSSSCLGLTRETQKVCDRGTGTKYVFRFSAADSRLHFRTGPNQNLDFVHSGTVAVQSANSASPMERAHALHLIESHLGRNIKLEKGTVYQVERQDDEKMGLYPKIGIFQLSNGGTAALFFYRQTQILLSGFCVDN